MQLSVSLWDVYKDYVSNSLSGFQKCKAHLDKVHLTNFGDHIGVQANLPARYATRPCLNGRCHLDRSVATYP